MNRSRRGWLLYALAWVFPTLAYAQLLAGKQGQGGAAPIAWTALKVIPAALLGVLVWKFSARFPFDERRPFRFAMAQVVAAAAYSGAWLAGVVFVIVGRMYIGADSFFPEEIIRRLPYIVRGFVGWQLLLGVMLYCLIAGFSYILRGERARRAQAEAIAAADALRARAELAALRGQLNPHFFFNTLHSVTALIQRNPNDAVAALQRLGDLFRYVLGASQDGADEARLADEWMFTKNYLALESLRLGDRLRVVDAIDPSTYNCVVPSLTLQPLVENAIAHAASRRAQPTTITIRARRANGQLTIEVADDGPGSTVEAALSGKGVGLRAVRQRILTAYPGIGAVDIDTQPGAGFRVALTVPADDGAAGCEEKIAIQEALA